MEASRSAPVTPLRATGRGEHWWPVALAIVITTVLHVALPAKYRVNPPWVGPAVALALLAALIIGDPGRIDRGGAAARAHHPYANPAFVFPEMMHTGYAPATWVPNFADYLSLACWTATAFSPTDVSAIKRWAKLLMMIEAVVSLGVGALVIARAINLLK